MSERTVVPRNRTVPKPEFHAALCEGLARTARKMGGMNHLADALEMTPKGLSKVFAGSIPCMKRLFDALSHDEHILDDVAALYKRKIVPKHRDEERAAPALAAALHKVIDAEEDGEIDHQELLAMESELRDADKRINAMLHRIAEIRKPRAVS